MRNPRIGARHLFAASLLLLTGASARAQQWWNPDYSRRVPVTIANEQDTATPNPTTAEITLSPIPAELRGDWTDIRVVYNNGTVVKDLDRQVLLDEAPTGTPPAGGSIRVVFRLVEPIQSFGTSNDYALYYGALSPTRPADDVYKIYDHIVDFLSAENVLDQPPPAWETLPNPDQITDPMYDITVKEYKGVKQGYFLPKYHHPQALVKDGSMPTFLNAEFYARVTPSTQASGEIQLLGRVPASPTNGYPDQDRAYGGGYAFAMDGWGEQNAIAHWTGLNTTKSPPYPDLTLMASTGAVKYYHKPGVTENMVLRITDTLAGKTWKDGDAQRPWDLKDVALEAGNPNPIYDKPGTVGFATYSQPMYVQFIAAREIRTVTNVGTAEVAPTGQARIAGTVRSSKTGPLADAPITISDGPNTWTVYSAADGRYQLSVPAGNYSVSASKEYHTPVNLTNVAPTVAGVTDVTLTYVGVDVSGTVSEYLSKVELAGALITVTDASGNFVKSATADAQGRYSVILPTGGTWGIGATTSDYSGRTTLTVASAASVTRDIVAAIPVNGDVEIPNETNSWPAGWAKDAWNAHATDGTVFAMTKEQNHTPGGHWSAVVRNPHISNNSGISDVWTGPAFRKFPVPPGDYTISAWIYADKPGLRAYLRTRTPGWDDGGGAWKVAGTDFPAGQWVELKSSDVMATGAPVSFIEFAIYTGTTNDTSGQPIKGNVYIDDVSISVTPKFVVIAKVADKNGSLVPNAYAGFFTDGGVAGAPRNLLQNFVKPNNNGEVRVFSATADPIEIGAVAHIGGDPDSLPDWGYLVDRKSAVPVAYNPNLSSPTVTLNPAQKAANAPGEGMELEEYTFHMVGSTPTRVDRSVRPTVDAFDNRFTTWSGNGGNQSLGIDAANPTGDKKPRWNVIDINLWENVSVDQFEFTYETAAPRAMKIWVTNQPLDSTSWPMVNPPDADLVLNSTDFHTKGLDGYMDIQPYIDAGYGWLGGLYHWVRLDQPKTGQYVRIWFDSYWDDGHTGFREIRILSKAIAIPPPYIMDDVVRVLKIAGGLEFSATTDLDAFDAVNDNVIDTKDAISMARQIATW